MTRFRFVEAEAAQFPVSLLCKTVGVTRQGYYAWKRRPPSRRELADRELSERIRAIHLETEEIYGAPRIYSELKLVDGIQVGKKRVARLMRQLGIRGADGRRGCFKTTVRDPKRSSAPDLVDRDFARAEPNRLWVCDLKYIQTGQGFLFLAAVQDVFSRRIIGWSMRDDLKAELVLDALGMAVTTRGGDAAGVVAHSDHGSQYTSLVYGTYAKQSGIDLSRARSATPGTTPWPRAASACSARSTTNSDTKRRPSRPNDEVSTETGYFHGINKIEQPIPHLDRRTLKLQRRFHQLHLER